MGVPGFPAVGVPGFPGAPLKSKLTEAKARQATRIRELGGALTASGLVTLDEQARALGLSRSTAWAVLKANHKASGLAADDQSNALFAGVAHARACDDFDVCRGEACRPLWPQQKTTAPICGGVAVRRQCPRGYSRLDHRHVGSVVMFYWGTATASSASRRTSSIKMRAANIGANHVASPPGSQPGRFIKLIPGVPNKLD